MNLMPRQIQNEERVGKVGVAAGVVAGLAEAKIKTKVTVTLVSF